MMARPAVKKTIEVESKIGYECRVGACNWRTVRR